MKRRLILVIAALTVAVILALAALLTSEASLRWAFARVAASLPGELRVEALHGDLLGPIRARGLVYRDAHTELRIGELALDWRPAALLRASLHVTELTLNDVQLRRTGTPERSGTAPWLALPITVELDAARLTQFVFVLDDATPLTLARAELRGNGRDTRVRLTQLLIEAERYSIAAAGQLDLAAPYPVDLELRWTLRAPPLAPLTGHGRLHGDSRQLATEQQLAAPWEAQLKAMASEVFGATNWSATLVTAALDPAAWHRDWATAALRAHINAQGDRRQLSAQGRIDLRHADQVFDGELRTRVDSSGVNLETLTLRERGGDATLSVAGHWQPGDGKAVALRGSWQALRWPLAGTAQVRSPQGRFTAQGTIQRYRYELDGVLDLARFGQLTLRSRGTGNRDGLMSEATDAQWLNGQLAAGGQVRWAPEPRWQLQLTGRELDPGVLAGEWPGRLALRATSHGRYGTQYDAAFAIEELAGTLRGRPVHLAGRASMAGDHYTLEALELRAGAARVQATGRVAANWQFAWQLAAPDLADLLPQAGGNVNASGRVSGPRQQPTVNARLSARSLAWRQDRIATLETAFDLDLTDQAESHVSLQAEGLRARGVEIDHADLTAQGRLREHRLQANLRRADAHARLEAAGGLQTGRWRGTLLDSEVGNARIGTWRQREPAALEIGADAFAFASLCLAEEAYHACVDGAGRTAQGGQLNAQLAGVPLAVLDPWLVADARLDGRVTGQARLALAADGGLDGELALDAGAGALRLGEAGEAATAIGFDAIALKVRTAADRLQATAVLTLTGAGDAQAALDMPYAPFKDRPAGDHALRGTLRAQLDELGLLALFAPQLLQPRGRVQLDAELGGSLESPQLRGEARLEQGRAGIAGLGITLDAVQASARSDDGRRIAIQAAARSGPGTLNVDGHVELGTDLPWRAQLQLRGQDFEAIHVPEYTLIGSPDLRLRAQPRAVALDGTMQVARATIAPRALRAGGKGSADVVVLGAAPEAGTERVAVSAEVRVLLGKQVRVMTYNVDATVEGDVTVRDAPGQPTTASGELRVVRGTYRAYGKDLDIDRGRLTFTGGPVDDPEVDLRAVRRVENVIAGIQARGRLQKPEVTLFSDPALDQTDILSYIVFGTSAQQTGSSEGAWLGQAVSALTLAGGEQLARGVGGAVGIEDVRIASGAGGGTSLMLGTYLSPRLYVSYGIGLFETGNSLRLRYDINQNWQIQTDTGAYTGADIIYKIER